MHEWEICKSQDPSQKAEKCLQTQQISTGIQDWLHFIRRPLLHPSWSFSQVFYEYSRMQSNLQGSGNFKGFEKPRAPYTLTDILSGCLAHLNSLTCELQRCTHWKRKHKCLCRKHGILHLDIQEGILQWILGWLSSRPWHHNRSGVHLWVQNLGKIRLNAFIAEWSYREKNE